MQAILIQFFAEISDRNWVVVLFLASWCPFWGLRVLKWQEACAVALGAGVALVLRSVLAVLLGGMGMAACMTAFGLVPGPVVLWILAGKAYMDYKSADESSRRRESAPLEADEEEIKFATDCFKLPVGPFPAEQPDEEPVNTSYGAADQTEKMKQGPLEAKQPGRDSGPFAVAFLVPLCCTLAVAISDPLRGSHDSYLLPLVAVTGALLAIVLAVLAGIMLERSVSDCRFLLVVAVSMALMAAASSSLAVLRLFPSTSPKTPTEVFLSLWSHSRIPPGS